MSDVVDISSTPAWAALEAHHRAMGATSLRQLFDEDPGRASRMSAGAAELVLDYSKHLATDETLTLLVELARAAGVAERRDAMFEGRHINTTENRAVLHIALRLPRDATLVVDGQDVVADVHRVLDRMGQLADEIRSGTWRGPPGNASAPWSTSASVARTSAPPWPTKRSSTMPTRTSGAASSRTSTPSTSGTRPMTSTQPPRCSW